MNMPKPSEPIEGERARRLGMGERESVEHVVTTQVKNRQ